MTKLRIKNFGPITDGCESDGGYIAFPKVALFCGAQGVGKSTVAKVYSSLSWLEKDLIRSLPDLQKLPKTEVNLKAILDWHGISDYLEPGTEIDYLGSCLNISYKNGRAKVAVLKDPVAYCRPKIMYMPAERNFASIVRNAVGVGLLPQALSSMQVEFEEAKKYFADSYKLPANGFGFAYDKRKHESWILNAGKNRTRLNIASSGLQSIVPLLLVTDYLAAQIGRTENRLASPAAVLRMQEQLRDALMTEWPEERKMEYMQRFFAPYCRFLNIVEEPEQNLYPATQCEAMSHLLSVANRNPDNGLVVCTHSPYLVNYMVTCAKAAQLYAKFDSNAAKLRRLEKFVPRDSQIASSDMALYEISANGKIKKLPKVRGLFSDANLLNEFLGKMGDDFSELLELED